MMQKLRYTWPLFYILAILIAFKGPGGMPISGILMVALLFVDIYLIFHFMHAKRWKRLSLAQKNILGQSVSSMLKIPIYLYVSMFVRASWGGVAVAGSIISFSEPREIEVFQQFPALEVSNSIVMALYIGLLAVAIVVGFILSSMNHKTIWNKINKQK